MKESLRSCLVVLALVCASAPSWSEVRLAANGSTGLAAEGLKGYLSNADRQERILIKTDEPQAYLLFFWDSRDLALTMTVTDASGKRVAEIDLSKGNILTLSKPGSYVCMLTARSGSGHWLCIALGSREWDP
jgi:hypothetical protein